MMKNLIFTLSILFSALSFSQSFYFPPNNSNSWDTLSLSSQNFCQTQVDSLYDFLDSNNTKGFILLIDGKIVLEKYFGSFTQDSAWYWASAGKTLTAFLIGVAQSDSLLNINDTSSNYLDTAWTSASRSQEEKIKIIHQLSMTTGLSDTVTNPDCTEDTCLKYLADAGTRWAYHNGPYTLLDSVLKVASGRTINSYHFLKVRNPIGMTGAYFKLGYNNVYFSKPRAMARFGLLLLNKGIWDTDTILKDSIYFKQMVSSSQNINPSYGYLTWLNGKASYKVPQSQISFNGSLNVDAPDDMYAAFGKNGQIISVTPSKSMVWIRVGDAPNTGTGLIAPVFSNEIWKRLNKLNCGSTGLSENKLAEKPYVIYPNPSDGKLHIQTKGQQLSYRLYYLNGKQLNHQGNIQGNTEIDISSLGRGFYIVELRTIKGDSFREKIIVK